MVEAMSISLPAEVKEALEDIAKEEGIAPDELIGQAMKQLLFLRRFRSLRDRLSARARGQGILTDEDVFDRVS